MKNFLSKFPEPLLSDIVNGHCIPIIGAGFSKNVNLPPSVKMPNWKDLGNYFAGKIGFGRDENPIEPISAYVHEYGRAKLIEELWDVLHIHQATPGEVHKKFVNLKFDTVLTTNFDFLLEETYSMTGLKKHVIIEENQLSVNLPLQRDRKIPKIIKIHGDLNHEEELVITEKDYDLFTENKRIMTTYISNIFITKTPLILGYSFTDPDFRSLWNITSERLGNSRRYGYVILINPDKLKINRYERNNIKVISYNDDELTYSKLYINIFEELKDYWDEQILSKSPTYSDETLSILSIKEETHKNLCFISIPNQLYSYYREYIYPTLKNSHLEPISGYDIVDHGDNIYAKVSAIINKSRIFIADLSISSVAVISEIGLAQSQMIDIILLGTKDTKIPSLFLRYPILLRPSTFDPVDDHFKKELEKMIEKIIGKIEDIYDEPYRLFDKGEYKSAFISAYILFETELNKIYTRKGLIQFNKIFSYLHDLQILDKNDYNKINEIRSIRNKVIHMNQNITKKEANDYVDFLMSLIKKLPNKIED